MPLTIILIIISFPSLTLSFIPDLKPSFSANPSHCSLSFSSFGLTTRIPQTFTVTSEHIRFLLFSFSVFTLFSRRAHVKIASRIVPYRWLSRWWMKCFNNAQLMRKCSLPIYVWRQSLAIRRSAASDFRPVYTSVWGNKLICRDVAETRSSAIAEGPRDAPCQLKPCRDIADKMRGRNVNAPLPPESKKIMKIWLRNDAFWSISE